MSCKCLTALLLFITVIPAGAPQEKTFHIRSESSPPPREIHQSIRDLLAEQSIHFFDPSSELIGELWFARVVPAEATAEQIKNGATYRELRETQVLGVVRFDQPWQDYRKQKIRPGVYTMRLGFQPAEGDHAGKSLYTEFILLSSAAKDTSAEPISPRDLIEMSRKSIDAAHPAVLMLFPGTNLEKTELIAKERRHFVLQTQVQIKGDGASGKLGIGLTLVGEAMD